MSSERYSNKSYSQKPEKRKSRKGLWLGLGLAILAATSAVAGGLLSYIGSGKFLMQSPLSPASKLGLGTPFTELTKPINVLILGIDNDDNFDHPQFSTKSTSFHAFSNPSDTMLLMRFLPNPHQINILSIPRDTLVHLPGIPTAKIDWANLVGGADLAKKVISEKLDNVQIDRYVRISRNGFIQVVDTLGGIEVNIPKKMDYTDETQHLNIHFLPGVQKLNGKHLEEYVRFRHDKLGDIGRVQRQQEVLKAIMQALLQPATIIKLPQILQVARENIDTDLSLDEILSLVYATLISDHSRNNFLMLPGRFSSPKEYSRSFWIADPKAASPILARYFGTGITNDTATGNTIAPSQIRIAVANATNQNGVAARAVAFLKKQGYTGSYITHIDTNPEAATKTLIIAQKGNREDAEGIQKLLGAGQVQVTSGGDVWSDITIEVGSDFHPQNSLTK